MVRAIQISLIVGLVFLSLISITAQAATVTYSIEGAGSGSNCGGGGCTLSGDFTFDDSAPSGLRFATDASFSVTGDSLNTTLDFADMFSTTVVTDMSGAPVIVNFTGNTSLGILNVCLAENDLSVCGPDFNTWILQEPFGGPIAASGAAGLSAVPVPAAFWLFFAGIPLAMQTRRSNV